MRDNDVVFPESIGSDYLWGNNSAGTAKRQQSGKEFIARQKVTIMIRVAGSGKVRTKMCDYYRSANFSTTRTLSPRTVIGIGTTLS